MFAHSAGAVAVHGAPESGVWFAREPESEFEKDLDESDEPVVLGSPDPAPKPPHLRPWILLLLLLMVIGGTYLASDPSLVLELIGQGPPSSPAPAPPPTIAQPSNDGVPAAPAVESPAPTLPATPTPEPTAVPTPAFAEGQRVTVQPDSSSPSGSVTLTLDAEGTRSGPTVRAGSSLTVLDAELHNNSWIYSVRAESGAKGWIQEMRLAAR